MTILKKWPCLVLAFLASSFYAKADEGMWLPMLLGDRVYQNMQQKGLQLTREQLFSLQQNSLKDAIVIFGAGCTGEVVSKEGLIFTNHHCGYDAIAGVSTVENNHLKTGFYASDRSKELPAQGLQVKFLKQIIDVSNHFKPIIDSFQGTERAKKITEKSLELTKKATGNATYKQAVIAGFFKGRQYLMFEYLVYKDVRLVGTPAESKGKFGGDTDNWEWPRHTADFSIFRVYADSAGNPADYAPGNKPLRTRYAIPIQTKGLKEGDFTMTYGYPGGTNRYETSLGVQLSTDINNPTLVSLRSIRLQCMREAMQSNEKVKLKLASEYASIANYWKFFDGETKQLLQYKVFEQKQKEESEFQKWAQHQPAYQSIFSEFDSLYKAWRPYAKLRMMIQEGLLGCRLIKLATELEMLQKSIENKSSEEQWQQTFKQVDKLRNDYLQKYDQKADAQILARMLQVYLQEIDSAQVPMHYYQRILKNQSASSENPFETTAKQVFERSMLTQQDAWQMLKDKPSLEMLFNDPAYAIVRAFVQPYQQKIQPLYTSFVAKNNDLMHLYLRGLFEMKPMMMKNTYPDANFTMRISYGSVAGYRAKDAVSYAAFTTMHGMMAKYKPNDLEFDLPSNTLQLAKNRTFGSYEDLKLKDLVVNFITTNDITGGNSGSPVLNGKGELVGLAFDGNYEALSHKLSYDHRMNRTICVDIRFVLWCIEYVGQAKHLLKELELRTF